MNPDQGGDAEDWFAKFEREAREAAQRREQEAASATAPPPAAEPVPTPESASPPPIAPQLANPFDIPAAAPLQPPVPIVEPEPTQAFVMREPEPTQAFDVHEPEPTQAMPLADPAGDQPTQALVPAPLVAPGPSTEPGSALDTLFGDDRFREYDSTLGPDPSNAPFAARARSRELVRGPAGGDGSPPPPRTFGRVQKILAGVGAGLLAVILLIGLFLLGTRLPDLLGPAPAVVTPSPTPTPTLTALPVGPVEPGDYAWDELLGGECLDPYVDAWQEDYTVVDCAEPHGGQLVARAWFPPEVVDPENPQVGKPDDPFPGVEALAARITILCSAPGVVDLAAAGAYTDVAVQGAYPVTAEQWEADPSYYCFVSRSSGEALTGSLAVPPPAPAAEQPAP